MQRLAGCMASLGRFISKFGERALPFFKIMKKSGTFKWTPEADKAFEDLKKYLASSLVMLAPRTVVLDFELRLSVQTTRWREWVILTKLLACAHLSMGPLV